MTIVPANKSDIEACENLLKASDEEVIEKLPELLEWVQDMNWPVASNICERLKNIGNSLIEPILSILMSTDETWKYSIISGLLSKKSSDELSLLQKELEKIAKSPTETEMAEEVHLVASEVLVKCQ